MALPQLRRFIKKDLPPLDLLPKHDVCATFYFTGKFVEEFLESVELIGDIIKVNNQ